MSKHHADSEKERIVIAGGSGFLGKALASALSERGYEPVVLSRSPHLWRGPGYAVKWDGETLEGGWARELDGARAMVNLTGKSVDCRRTRRNREEILSSRINSTRVLGEALRQTFRPPEVWIQASSLAIYGNAGDRMCDEAGFVPDEFPTDVVRAWEAELGTAIRPEMRWAVLRIGFVLGRQGGALPTLARLARNGFGGTIGSGRQWISWLHEDDMVRLFIEAIENQSVNGICNASGLQPVTNAEFMAALRRVVGAPVGIPTPSWLVRSVAPLIDTDPDLALNGRRGLPCRIHGLGFRFHHHELEDALVDLLIEPQTSRPGRASKGSRSTGRLVQGYAR
ncbi:MAG: TIGR01777 family oxidoreductase [Verrucomicrobiota bacterium]